MFFIGHVTRNRAAIEAKKIEKKKPCTLKVAPSGVLFVSICVLYYIFGYIFIYILFCLVVAVL